MGRVSGLGHALGEWPHAEPVAQPAASTPRWRGAVWGPRALCSSPPAFLPVPSLESSVEGEQDTCCD